MSNAARKQGFETSRIRSYLPWIVVAQVAIGVLGIPYALVTENLLLRVLSSLTGSWFWIPLALSYESKIWIRKVLLYGLAYVVFGIAVCMGIAVALSSTQNISLIVAGIGIVGIICFVTPMIIAYFVTNEQSAGQVGLHWQGGLKSGPISAEGVEMSFDYSDPDNILVNLHVDPARFLNHEAEFEVFAVAEVHDSRGINKKLTLHKQALVLRDGGSQIAVPVNSIRSFDYSGKMVDIKVYGGLKINDGFLWDTTVQQPCKTQVLQRPSVAGNAKQTADPKDYFSLARNLMAIPLQRKLNTLGLCVVGMIVMVVNSVVGYHDQFSPEADSYFYSLEDNDGDAQSPLLNSLMLSGSAGAAVWLAIRRQLGSYIIFRFNRVPTQVTRDTVVSMKELVWGKSRIDLTDFFVRVVACNLEKGSYTRGSGSSQRTVTFSEPSRAVVLYEKHLPLVKRGTSLEQYLEGSFSFEPMFDVLYPPNIVSKSHGLFVQWEVQLIHDKLIDHELVAPSDNLREEDFFFATHEEMVVARG